MVARLRNVVLYYLSAAAGPAFARLFDGLPPRRLRLRRPERDRHVHSPKLFPVWLRRLGAWRACSLGAAPFDQVHMAVARRFSRDGHADAPRRARSARRRLSFRVDARRHRVAATFANLLLSLRFAAEDGFFADLSPIHRRLSDFSYSLYATHAPLCFFVWAGVGSLLGRDWYKALPTPSHWALAFALIAAAIVIAYGFSRLTEARTKQLRDFFTRRPARSEQSGGPPSGRTKRFTTVSPCAAARPRRREAGDGHAEGRAGDVIDANLLKEVD